MPTCLANHENMIPWYRLVGCIVGLDFLWLYNGTRMAVLTTVHSAGCINDISYVECIAGKVSGNGQSLVMDS